MIGEEQERAAARHALKPADVELHAQELRDEPQALRRRASARSRRPCARLVVVEDRVEQAAAAAAKRARWRDAARAPRSARRRCASVVIVGGAGGERRRPWRQFRWLNRGINQSAVRRRSVRPPRLAFRAGKQVLSAWTWHRTTMTLPRLTSAGRRRRSGSRRASSAGGRTARCAGAKHWRVGSRTAGSARGARAAGALSVGAGRARQIHADGFVFRERAGEEEAPRALP